MPYWRLTKESAVISIKLGRAFIPDFSPATYNTLVAAALDASSRFTGSHSGLEIAHEYGYFDQAHMVRDLDALGGKSSISDRKEHRRHATTGTHAICWLLLFVSLKTEVLLAGTANKEASSKCGRSLDTDCSRPTSSEH
jgi:hypothetical protein